MKSGFPFIEWQYLVFRHNESELDMAKQLAARLRVDKLSFTKAILENMGRRTGENEQSEFLPTNKRFRREKEEKRCRWLWTHGVINWDGTVSPCCWAYNQQDDFGNILDSDFLAIWTNEKFQRARRIFSAGLDYKSETICDRCIKTKNWKEFVQSRSGRRWLTCR